MRDLADRFPVRDAHVCCVSRTIFAMIEMLACSLSSGLVVAVSAVLNASEEASHALG
jgi:hypothetical protein